jgi:Flp pilus assembly protein TadG
MARSHDRERSRKDRGATAAEAALVLPMILIVLFGIIDFGRMINAQIVVSQAAREAARAASVGGSAEARAATAAASIGGVNTAADDCPDDPGAGDDATATVTYQFEFVTPVAALAGIALGPSVTLSATGVMPCRG